MLPRGILESIEMEEKNNKITEQEEVKESKTSSKLKASKKKATTSKKKPAGDSKLKTELEESKIKLAEATDRYLRLSAEFDNYRKRTLKEKMELTKTGGERILLNILPVVDNLDRASAAIKDAKDIDAVKVGLDLITSKFYEFMEQNGVKEIPSMHVEFDTDVHEAITKIPSPEEDLKGKVVDVIEKGYFLHDKVIRFSKVVIGE